MGDPWPRARGGARDQAGQGRRAKPLVEPKASPRTPTRRRYRVSSARAGSWNQPSRADYARPVPELRLEPIDDLGSVREEWTALAEQGGNLFATWEWADAWWRVYGDDRQLVVRACRGPDGRLVAVLPLYLSTRRPLRTLRFLGHGPADQLGPVCAPEDRTAVAEALKRLLQEEFAAWDLLLAERLAPAEGWAGALGGRVVHREESPTLLIAGRSFEEFLASRSK